MRCYGYVKHRCRKMNDSEKIANEDEMSRKGKKLRSYPAKMKEEAVKHAEINGNKATGLKHVADSNRICKG